MIRGAAWLAGACALFALGCGGKTGGPAQGTERGACFDNGTCEPGLACLSNVCVFLPVDGGGGESSNPGTAGAGGTGGSAMGAGGSAIGGSAIGGSAIGGTATGGAASGGTGGSGTGGSGTGGTFPAASHQPLPQLANLGGPVLTAPKIRPIFFGGETNQTDMMSFLSEVATGSYWHATTSEYGVGTITVLPAVTLNAPSSTIADTTLQSLIATNTAALSGSWGVPDPSTIYAFILPPNLTVTAGGATCCTSFGGYHDEAIASGIAVPYVVSCACPDFFGAGWDPEDERTVAMSHELVEAATDPFPRSDPAFSQANQANLVWTLITGGEAGDMCVMQQPDAFALPAGARHMVQKTWSNAAARAGQDPCVPAAPSPPYFNSMPALDVISVGSGYETHGLLIPLGSSRTIDLDLFSAGTVAGGWTVTPYSYEDLFGGTPSLAFSLDRSTGKNGDVLRLTISALRTNATIGADPFIILSSSGTPGDPGYRAHLAMGLVTTN
jgi:hypothetical protein